MNHRIFAICLACIYLIADLAHAGEPRQPTRTRYADFAVDARGLGSAETVVARRVRERAAVVLLRSGVLPLRSDEDPVISVVIDELTGDDPGYVFRLEILRAGAAATKPVPIECKLCTEGELVGAVEARLELAVADLPDVTPEAATVPPPRVDPTQDTSTSLAPGKPPGPAMKIAGATLVGVGLAATITGAVLGTRAPKPKPGDYLNETSTKKPGFALLGLGLGVAITGAVLLIVDARRRAAPRRSSTARAR